MLLGHPDFSVVPSGKAVTDDALFFHIQDNAMLLAQGNLPTWKQVKPLMCADFQPFELARSGERSILSVMPHSGQTIAENDTLRYHEVNLFRSMSADIASIIASCLHLWRWYENHRYCGKCAFPLEPAPNERALSCSVCGNLVFPTISPAIIVAITCGDRILLARNVRYQHYALIAGYVEVGETLEHALRREVMEEVGLEIHDIRYLGDQPWGISGSQMFAFHAQADDKAALRIQKSELSDARWFHRSEVPSLPHKVSIAYEMIERFRNKSL